MATAKKYPEFEAPAVVIDAVKGYLGPARMAKLTAHQRARIATMAQETATVLGHILDNPGPPPSD